MSQLLHQSLVSNIEIEANDDLTCLLITVLTLTIVVDLTTLFEVLTTDFTSTRRITCLQLSL